MAAEPDISVEVVYAGAPRSVQSVSLTLPAKSTVADAICASGVLQGLDAETADQLQVSVWGRRQRLDAQLRTQDRVELCRPLKVDPKVARRERFARQGAGRTGLFARRRAGAKAGY
jgi:uncharacterized protein